MSDVLSAITLFEHEWGARCAITRTMEYPPNGVEDSFFQERMHGSMEYLVRHRKVKRSLTNVLPGAKSAVVCAFSYPVPESTPVPIAGYAWGEDYHARVARLLTDLADRLDLPSGSYRICVDACPVPERSMAAAAGLGWIGRSGNLIVPGLGPNVVLGEIITTEELCVLRPFSMDPSPDSCGSCTLCLDACPTGALMGDGLVDATRCLSYHTTENREFPTEEAIGVWGPRIFGCDECVAACPYTVRGAVSASPLVTWESLPSAIHLSRRDLRGTAMERLSMWRWLRNVALALSGHPDGEEALHHLARHDHPQVRKAAEHSLSHRSL